MHAIAGMMTTNFGYHIEPGQEGDGVFAYWDQNNIWPELELVISERFVPERQTATWSPRRSLRHAENYTGYRAGIRLVNGSWKFAYFVNGKTGGWTVGSWIRVGARRRWRGDAVGRFHVAAQDLGVVHFDDLAVRAWHPRRSPCLRAS